MYNDRKSFYQKIESEYNSKVVAYITGNRPGLECQVGADVPDILIDHLDCIGKVNKISLILYTNGGDTLAAWNIINLIREFCDELDVIVPNRCRSAGTLMSLGANNIIMSKQATLGPVDPSIISPMSPVIPNTNPPQKLPISVESVKGYFSLLEDVFEVKDESAKSSAYTKLVDYIHPLVLGEVYRTQKQIQMMATKLLKMTYKDDDTIKRIVSFLCSESGNHNYPISRTEAKNLGLKVESPTQDLYENMKKWFQNISDEMMLKIPYNLANVDKNITNNKKNSDITKGVLLETLDFGQSAYISESVIDTIVLPQKDGTTKQSPTLKIIRKEWRYSKCGLN